jgi:predicted nucleotidyltransferase
MINLLPEHIDTIKQIINRYLNNPKIKIFGSRTNGSSNKNSDIDIAIISDKKIDFKTLAEIKIAFEESDIPYRVDIIDYISASENFKKIIDSSSEWI